MPLSVGRSRRGWRAAAIVLACGWLADHYALPALTARGVQDALARGGYPDARFEVESVGLDRVRLRDVRLADGVELGRVELDVGLSALWGGRPERATITGARIALDAVKRGPGGGPGGGAGGAPPVGRVRLERAELTRGGDRATVTGDLSLAGPLAADLRATGIRIGGVAVDVAALRVREAAGGRYDAAWELRGAGWTARGDGTLARRAGAPELLRSHTELRGAIRIGALALEGARAGLDVTGPLDAPVVRGELRAERAVVAARATRVTLHDVRAPIAFAGAAWPRVPWQAARAEAGALRAAQLTGSADLATDTHAIAWRSLEARSAELGRGSIELRIPEAGSVRLERGRLEAAGGELVAGPAELPAGDGAAPAELVVTARGLRLGRLLPERAVAATALLDGEFALRLAGDGVTFVRGELRARGRGTIRVRDPALRRRAGKLAGLEQQLEHRLIGALADFEHTSLAAVLAPPGGEPELRVTARGRGSRVPQELDLAINFRGVWTALDRLARSSR